MTWQHSCIDATLRCADSLCLQQCPQLLQDSPVCHVVLPLLQQQQGEPPGSLACPKHVCKWPAGGQHTWASGTAEGGGAQTAEQPGALRAGSWACLMSCSQIWLQEPRLGLMGSPGQSCFSGSGRAGSCLAALGPAAFSWLPVGLLGSGSAAWKSAPTLGFRSTPTPYLHWQGCCLSHGRTHPSC